MIAKNVYTYQPKMQPQPCKNMSLFSTKRDYFTQD